MKTFLFVLACFLAVAMFAPKPCEARWGRSACQGGACSSVEAPVTGNMPDVPACVGGACPLAKAAKGAVRVAEKAVVGAVKVGEAAVKAPVQAVENSRSRRTTRGGWRLGSIWAELRGSD